MNIIVKLIKENIEQHLLNGYTYHSGFYQNPDNKKHNCPILTIRLKYMYIKSFPYFRSRSGMKGITNGAANSFG